MRQYYEAYDERYKTAHAQGVSWMETQCTPIVLDMLRKYCPDPGSKILEIGCGEGRDSGPVLAAGYDLLATDISPEAISYCRAAMPEYREHFARLDCIGQTHEGSYDFIYSVAVIHMFVLDEHRMAFYRFIKEHLKEDAPALICTMGDGTAEMHSDIDKAFELQEREHSSGKMMVACTSCRMVSFVTFERELKDSGLQIVEKGITSSMPSFSHLMYCVVKRAE